MKLRFFEICKIFGDFFGIYENFLRFWDLLRFMGFF